MIKSKFSWSNQNLHISIKFIDFGPSLNGCRFLLLVRSADTADRDRYTFGSTIQTPQTPHGIDDWCPKKSSFPRFPKTRLFLTFGTTSSSADCWCWQFVLTGIHQQFFFRGSRSERCRFDEAHCKYAELRATIDKSWAAMDFSCKSSIWAD